MAANTRLALFHRVARTPQLRRLYLSFTGYSISEHGTWLAIMLYAHVEGGPAAVGVVAVLQLLPSVVLTPFSAYAGDRFRPRRVLAIGYAVQCVSMAATALAMAVDRPYAAYGFGSVAATAICFTRPVMGTLLPIVTHDPADLVAATVVMRVIEQVGMLVGPIAGGLVLAIGSPEAVFGGAAVITGAGAAAVASLRDVHDERRTMPDGRTAVRQFTAGFAAVRADRLLIALMLFVVAAGLVRGIDERLDGGGGASGLLSALYGVGGLLAATTVTRLVGVRQLSRTFLTAGLVAAAGSAALASAMGYLSATPGFVLLGAGEALLTILAVVTIQRVAPTDVLARVFGIVEGVQMGCLAIGSAAVTALTSTWSLGTAFVVMAVAVGVVVGFAVMSIRRSGHTIEAANEATVARLLADPVLAPLPAPVIERLARAAERLHVPAGADVVTEGEPGDRYYLVVAGSVEVLIRGKHVRVLGPGTSFGEIALLHAIPRTATATAAGEVELIAIERDAFLEAVTGHPRSFDLARDVSDRWLAGG
jgi:predicted MFS family arabinose efflux permease